MAFNYVADHADTLYTTRYTVRCVALATCPMKCDNMPKNGALIWCGMVKDLNPASAPRKYVC